MWNKNLVSLAWVFVVALVLASCSGRAQHTTQTGAGDASGNYNNNNNSSSSSAKEITAFSINSKMGIINGTNITVEIPHDNIDITDLTPTIEVSAKASINPASGVAGDFTNPLTYTVTAADGSTKVYTVTVILTYKLRDTGPAGGLVFYDKGSYSDGWRYLEAALTSLPPIGGTGWSNVYNVLVGTGEAIDAGKTNTFNIIAQPNHTGSAAKLCSIQTTGGNDWFLPSKDQLNKMYINLKSGTDENGDHYTAVGSFTAGPYWSSSEFNLANVDIQNFNTGQQLTGGKSSGLLVRCVRSF
jgi:hypothetical protein